MQPQRGNFLLQALLALTLLFAFIPFFTRRLYDRDMDSTLAAATRQIETLSTVAKIYVRENLARIPADVTVLSGNNLTDALEEYGLPIGFATKNALGQDMILVLTNQDGMVSAQINITGGNVRPVQVAELARRVGFYAVAEGRQLFVGVPLDEGYTDIVRRNQPDLDAGRFLTDLDMGGFSIGNAGGVIGRRGEFETAEITRLALFGTENGRKERNSIARLDADKTTFQSVRGETALSLTRGTLSAENVSARTVAQYGDTGSFSADAASVYEFSMTAGRSGFVGPAKWNIRGSMVTDKINLSVERIDISSSISAARGQDVFITDELEVNTRSGIEADTIAVSNITLRDQTSDAINAGGTGAVVLDIRPAGTSYLPDVLVAGIDNGAFKIIARPDDDGGDTIECKAIISRLGGNYNQNSMAQNLICQYVFWQRLERRINIKKCIMDGHSDCK